ncbi:hypothetical protein M427DRAFT_57860 [Gonapodya prolifera JEL478]|uniref:Uncharacterized protein n=1 Tax=Gonapodya prolifera (strain JEL478) TaxID=1344416 RepID=A0A139ABH9_GONPJ|nr:hypothetical protein M427DRAFT_57860 [Gonapodya prolifera JEL478]|eukprot:KXS14078.1 hypothetical protein M427DRAFT_57860 [Gonapodya prolifera JEL478]
MASLPLSRYRVVSPAVPRFDTPRLSATLILAILPPSTLAISSSLQPSFTLLPSPSPAYDTSPPSFTNFSSTARLVGFVSAGVLVGTLLGVALGFAVLRIRRGPTREAFVSKSPADIHGVETVREPLLKMDTRDGREGSPA